MIFIYCTIHGMNGKPIGMKIFAMKGMKGSTIKIFKRVYSNIVQIDGKLKKLGGVL